MLKITRLSNLAPKTFKTNNNKVVRVDSYKTNKMVVNLSNKSKNKMSKN